jgi:hypothetical protein
MTYHKVIAIKGRVFSEDDIIRLANIIKDLYNEDDYKLEFMIKNNDESWVTGGDLSIFETDYFKRKPVVRIDFEFLGRKSSKNVDVELFNSLKYSNDSTINIKGDDEVWFNSICSKLSDFIKDTTPQKSAWKLGNYKVSNWLQYIISTILSIISELILFQNVAIQAIVSSGINFFALFAILFAIYSFILSKMFNALEKAYPCIEFQFGIEKTRGSENTRRIWSWVVPALILPAFFFILSLIVSK